MKSAAEIFTELGERFETFGKEMVSQSVIARAHAANPWFMPQEIRRAVGALRSEMLRCDRIEAWLGRYDTPTRRPRRVLVVMAGNIPLVGFFDLLCVVASGHRCAVKPSSKDCILIEYVIEQLLRIEPQLPIELYDGRPVEAVIATGSDNANRYFRAAYGELPTLLRGSRHSVAVLTGRESARQLAGLSDDIFAYSGLGCRNVSLIFLPRGCDLRLAVPQMNPKYRRNYLQTRTLAAMTGRSFRDLGGAILTERTDFPTALSEIACLRYDDLSQVRRWLDTHDSELQCVVTEAFAHPRRVDFGRTQSPGLTDYPDDVDVMRFLLSL